MLRNGKTALNGVVFSFLGGDMNEKKIGKLVRFLKQPSTHKGIIVILGACGVTVTPEYKEAIGMGSIMLFGLYEILMDEDKKKEAPPEQKMAAPKND